MLLFDTQAWYMSKTVMLCIGVWKIGGTIATNRVSDLEAPHCKTVFILIDYGAICFSRLYQMN